MEGPVFGAQLILEIYCNQRYKLLSLIFSWDCILMPAGP
jgi:hypothetical protein